MALQIPSLKQTVNNTLHVLQTAFKPNDDATAQQTPLAAKLRRDNDYVQAFAIGAAVHGIYKFIRDFVAKQSCPLTATGTFLKWWGQVYAVYQKSRTAAQGPVLVSGVNGTVIPANTVLQRPSDSWEFKVDTDATITGGTALVYVTSSVGGFAGNTPDGINLSLPTPIVGVTSLVVTTDGDFVDGLSLGTDDELEDDFKSRIIFRIQNPPHGGAPSDYELWAREVPGVSKAWAERIPSGPGTVGLRFMMATGFPTVTDQTNVTNYITDDTRGPAADDLTVYLLTANTVAVTITGLDPSDLDTKAAVHAELQDLFFRFQRPGATLPLSHINEAISIAAGEYDHVLAAPVANPTAGANEILTLGTLTINGVVYP